MIAWIVKKGNTSVQVLEVRDKDDNVVTNLSSATSIKFQVKEEEDETSLISKTAGSGIEVDTPTQGSLRITILPTDTASLRSTDRYMMACEIEWSSTEKYEVYLYISGKETDRFVVEEHIIT